MILVIFKLLAESILIAYAGWKTRQVGSSLFACFKVGVICCLAALLAGLVMQLSVEYSNLEKAQWIYLVATLIVAEKLLLFWLSGLIGLFGGKLYGDKLPRLQDGE